MTCLLSLSQLLGPPCGVDDGFHDSAAKSFLLQRVKSRDRRPARRGDLVFQLAEVLSAFECHPRGAVYRLQRQFEGHISG